jgi:hypothetical protein
MEGVSFVRLSNGRWHWSDNAPMGKMPSAAVVSFASKAEAQEDLEQHTKGSFAMGRFVTSKDHIQTMVRAATDACADCKDAHFGGVYWHEIDEMGCNWSISTMQGPDWKGCFDCVQPTALQLRKLYSIPDEG